MEAIRVVGRTDTHAASRPMTADDDRAIDLLRPFQGLVRMVRWGTLAVSAGVLVGLGRQARTETFVSLGLLAAWSLYRTLWPVRFIGRPFRTGMAILVELMVGIVAVASTGYWDSPLVFCLLPGVVIAGFAQSGPLVGMLGLLTGCIISAGWVLSQGVYLEEHLRPSVQWTVELTLVALVAGFGNKLLDEAHEARTVALDRMSQLTEANDLLVHLHKVAQSLPASLDLDDVLLSTIANLRGLHPAEVVAIFLRDETLPTWVVARAEGVRLPTTMENSAVPAGVLEAARSEQVVRLEDVVGHMRPTMSPNASSGLYVPLRSRGLLIGVLALENGQSGLDDERSAQLVSRFADPAALAIDNARWFGRIRTVTADEERVRIARDLHDRIGQSLAFVGFELDRVHRSAKDNPLSGDIASLRANVRNVVTEVRETLYDLRTEVSEAGSLVETLDGFLDRVAARTGIAVRFDYAGSKPLPLRQERELWRIAQEAIVNVERHASATSVEVRFRSDGHRALLEVRDNGRGFSSGAGRVDSYGMLGLRERASAIGAKLDIESRPGHGTLVRCRITG